MAVRIGCRKVQVSIATLIRLVRDSRSLFTQIESQGLDVRRLKCDMREAVILVRKQPRKNLNVLPVINLEVCQSHASVFFEKLEGLFIAEQVPIERSRLSEVAHLK